MSRRRARNKQHTTRQLTMPRQARRFSRYLDLLGQAGKEVVLKVLDVDVVPARVHLHRLDPKHLGLDAQRVEPAVAGVLGGGVA